MIYKHYNPNPTGRYVGDCSVRAVSKALDISWDEAYSLTTGIGREMGDMPSADAVWGAVLKSHGFRRRAVPNTCPNCYTAEMFCLDHPHGIFVLAFGNHVATVIDGYLYDSWDSSREIPIYYWHK